MKKRQVFFTFILQVVFSFYLWERQRFVNKKDVREYRRFKLENFFVHCKQLFKTVYRPDEKR